MCRFTYDILRPGREPVGDAAPERARAASPRCVQNTPQRVLGRRGAAAARATNRRCWSDRHVDRRPREHEAFGGGKGRREQITWLPEPEPRERAYTVISVDDHVVEPPDAFAGRFPKKFADDEPRVVADRRRRRGVGLAGAGAAERRLQRGGRPPVDRVRLRADPLRRDAPRRVGCERARRRHGHRRRVGVAVLPVVPARASSANGSRCGRTTTSSRSPRCARTTTGTSKRGAARTRSLRPEPDRVPPRPRDRGARRSAATRRAASRP